MGVDERTVPFDPMLGGSDRWSAMSLFEYFESRYQRSRPGALYGVKSTLRAPSAPTNRVAYA